MKNSKKLVTLVLALVLTVVCCSCASAAGKKKITLRIGSGHSETNPWIAAVEEYFVPTVSERVANETDYEIEWIKSYGGSVITLGNEIQGIQDGLVDIGCSILVFEASRLPLQTMVYCMPFSCSDPQIVAKVVRRFTLSIRSLRRTTRPSIIKNSSASAFPTRIACTAPSASPLLKTSMA